MQLHEAEEARPPRRHGLRRTPRGAHSAAHAPTRNRLSRHPPVRHSERLARGGVVIPIASCLVLALAAPEPTGLTLEAAVAEALARNERAGMATEDVAIAEARVAEARAYFF